MDKIPSTTRLRAFKKNELIKPIKSIDFKRSCNQLNVVNGEGAIDRNSFITDVVVNMSKQRQMSYENYEKLIHTEIDKNITPIEENKPMRLKPPKLSRRSSMRLSFHCNDDKTKEELDVMKLNNWNKNSNIQYDNKYLRKKYADVEIRDRKKSIQDSLANSKTIKFSNTLSNFYKKIEQENAAIFIQNINLAKESFKFELFAKEERNSKDINTGDIDKKELIQVGRNVTFIDKKNLIPDDNILLKYYHLKMQGEYSKLTSREYYNEIVNEKEKIENIYKRE
jgi:hypothetical protein